MTEVGAETISVISESELCKFSMNPKFSKGHSNNEKKLDSEVSGERNSWESILKKLFSLSESGKIMISTFSGSIGVDGKEKEGKISPVSSVLTLGPVPWLESNSNSCAFLFLPSPR